MSTFQFLHQKRLLKFRSCGFFKIKVENHKHKEKILDIAYQYERRVDDHHVKNSFISNTDYEDEIQSLEWAKIVFCKTSNNLKTKINKLYGEHHIDVVDFSITILCNDKF